MLRDMPRSKKPQLNVERPANCSQDLMNKPRLNNSQRQHVNIERFRKVQEARHVLKDGHLMAPGIFTHLHLPYDLRSLPTELLLMIINDHLSNIDAVALALTCRKLYEVVIWAR
jgi:hypothetical protein